jgi:uncharacterized membrane protein
MWYLVGLIVVFVLIYKLDGHAPQPSAEDKAKSAQKVQRERDGGKPWELKRRPF